jgi:hypothetical protein
MMIFQMLNYILRTKYFLIVRDDETIWDMKWGTITLRMELVCGTDYDVFFNEYSQAHELFAI